MLEVWLHRDPNDPDGSPVLLTLPASQRDLLAAQAAIRADSLREVFVEMGAVQGCPHLTFCLRQVSAEDDMVGKLNFFASRMRDMTPAERWSLDALCYLRGPDTMSDLINLSHSTDTLVSEPDVSDEYQLGEFLVENGFREFSEEVIPYLDFAKIGWEHLAENTCGFVGNTYCEHTGDVAEVYDGMTPPECREPDFIFRVELAEPDHTASGDQTVKLSLPAGENDIAAALDVLSVQSLSDCVIVNGQSGIERFAGLLNAETDPSALNSLAGRITAMSDDGYIKFLAVAEHQLAQYGLESAATLCDLAARLDDFIFNPEITDVEQLARNELSFEVPEIIPFVDLAAYGRHWLQERGAAIGSLGYVREIVGPEQVQSIEPEVTYEPQMGGM